MGKYQRTKGHNFERETAREMQAIGFKKAKRNLEYQEGVGIDVSGCDPFVIQCKVGKQPNIRRALNEIKTPDSMIGVVRAKWDRSDDIAAMRWEDFKILVEWAVKNGEI